MPPQPLSPSRCGQACCSPLSSFASPRRSAAKPACTSAVCRRDFAAKATATVFPNTHFTNHESLPSLPESFSLFLTAFPQYLQTDPVDQIRATEYPQLKLSNHTCLDYIGIGLFSYRQLHRHQPDFPFFSVSFKSGGLKEQLLQNGHESGLETDIKRRIFGFLNFTESDYSMVFTANRTSAFKLLTESYPFQSSNKLLTVYDYESEAVDAMVSSSEKRGARAMAAEFSWPRLRIRSRKLKEMIVSKNKRKKTKRGLFVFPLHSRITGARYPYLWMSVAQENRWHVLVDACGLGPKDMDSFGLSVFRPDFLVCSFYKVFGENPSGFGCLFVKKSVIPVLEPSSSSSPGVGIVHLVPADYKLFQPELQIPPPNSLMAENNLEIQTADSEPEAMECRCLDQVDSLGLITISTRARCLINWLVSAMMKLKHPHSNGGSLVRIYGPKIKFERGAALAFNVLDWKGEKVEPVLVQKLADRSNISLSYGFLHHMWFPEKYAEEKGRVMERREGKGDVGISVVTAALGFLTNFEDVYRLWVFVARFLDADFVEKERWRYSALDHKTIEV